MAFSLTRSFLLVSLLLAFVSSIRGDLVDQVCSKTANPSHCNQVLRSDPRAGGSNLHGLCIIAIEKALEITTSIKHFVDKLSEVVTNPVLKERYNICGHDFGDAVILLNIGRKFLNDPDYFKMLQSVVAALASDLSCELQFVKPPSEAVLIKQGNQEVQDRTKIVAVIAGFLVRGGRI